MFLQFGTNDYVVLLLSNNTNIQNKVDSYLVKRVWLYIATHVNVMFIFMLNILFYIIYLYAFMSVFDVLTLCV